MPLSNTEFAAIMADHKRIDGDIYWQEDEDHSPARQFRADIYSGGGWSLFIQGRYNRGAAKLTYSLILRTDGRIYGLCLGNDHHNPQCNQVGDRHLHRWTERYRDKEAHVAQGITTSVANPVAVWREFCAAAGIVHNGSMYPPR